VSGGVLQPGKTLLVMGEAVLAAGSQTRIFTLDSDTFQTSLFVSSITGQLDITIYTLTQEGREKEVITYSNVTATTNELLLKKAATAMGVVKVVAVYTGACSFELRAKGLSSGETSAKIQSANVARASQITIYTNSAILLPAALSDRKGVIVKNNSNNGTLYIGFSQTQAASSIGYPLGKGEALSLDIGAGATLWAVASSGLIDVRIIEAGG